MNMKMTILKACLRPFQSEAEPDVDIEVEGGGEEMSREALARSNSQKAETDDGGPAAGDAKAQWSSQSYLLEEISQQFTLPQVIIAC